MISHRFTSARYHVVQILTALCITASAISLGFAADVQTAGMHVYGGTQSIQNIDAQVFYYVPADVEPLPDWWRRVAYHLDRAREFHEREFTGQSELNFTLHAAPFVASVTQAGMPQDDVNAFYWKIMNDVWHSDAVRFRENAMPIILVFSDVNFSPSYDDWTRECSGEGCLFPEPHTECRGHVIANGEDRPGTRCGGARALYWPEKRIGLGLVTADGWRVPIRGTDCVAYHEGIGHAIALPHPEPIDNSVMGLAQYVGGIHDTRLRDDQRLALGWQETNLEEDGLFSTFDVSHSPSKPSAMDTVRIQASWPNETEEAVVRAEAQWGLREPFRQLSAPETVSGPTRTTASWDIQPLPDGKSLAYRVRIITEIGDSEEIWGYYKVRE